MYHEKSNAEMMKVKVIFNACLIPLLILLTPTLVMWIDFHQMTNLWPRGTIMILIESLDSSLLRGFGF